MTKYGLNVNLGLRFETKARRTAAINKLKELRALLEEGELIKVNVRLFDDNEETTHIKSNVEEVDLEA